MRTSVFSSLSMDVVLFVLLSHLKYQPQRGWNIIIQSRTGKESVDGARVDKDGLEGGSLFVCF